MKRSSDQEIDPEDDSVESTVETEEQKAEPITEDSPFLDSFYGISSSNPAERAQAGQILIHHALTGPSSNLEDAKYAFKRLLRGLCSGRAAARQGNAATLATFLKICFERDTVSEMNGTDASNLEFVLQQLRENTSPGEGRKKGSEERDYQFGRLFGINGIIRSGILLPIGESGDLDAMRTTTKEVVDDLYALYDSKKWIREPSTHAVCTLLSAYYDLCPTNEQAVQLVNDIVQESIVPNFFQSDTLETFSAEQLALGMLVQSHHHLHGGSLPAPLHEPILTRDNMAVISSALSSTSAVTQPRTHLVWDVLWMHISEPTGTVENVVVRTARSQVNEEPVSELVESLLQHVVMKNLLGMEESRKAKTTHDRSALALCLVRNLAGVEFVSSLSARTRLVLDTSTLERFVFGPALVKKIFLDIICAGSGKRQSSHLLKPFALQVLSLVTQPLENEGSIEKRLAIAKALLRSESKFDSRTKTTTVGDLLGLSTMESGGTQLEPICREYMAFLTQEILSTINANKEQVIGYLDLLFQLGKLLLRTEPKEDSFQAFKVESLDTIIAFYLSAAFYDCSEVSTETPKKKKGKKHSSPVMKSVLDIACMIKGALDDEQKTPSYHIRSMCSARFFSLVADSVGMLAGSSNKDKEAAILAYFVRLRQLQEQLVGVGAKTLRVEDKSDDDMETDERNPDDIVASLVRKAQDFDKEKAGDVGRPRERWVNGIAILASALGLHYLSIGQSDSLEADDDEDDPDEETDEICSFLLGLADVSLRLEEETNHLEEDEKPLGALAGLCATILSSQLAVGSQSRGASPTLIRQSVKYAWSGGLVYAAEISVEDALDSGVVDVLLNAIGVIDDSPDGPDDDNEAMAEDSESDSDQSGEGVFAKVTNPQGADESMNTEDKSSSSSDDGENDDLEMQIDESKLQSLLQEDSDAEVDASELEHHEGADEALARLIQLRQDARKAGRTARERLELARQTRCILLLDVLVVGKADTWAKLLRVDYIMQMCIPILAYRRDLVRSAKKLADKGNASTVSEKSALSDRLGNLLKSKILKTKVPESRWTDGIDIVANSKEIASQLFRLSKESVDKDQPALCNSAVVYLLRHIDETDHVLEISQLYSSAVTEWATKRSSHLETSYFEHLIHNHPVVAQGCLCSALSSAATSGRSTFLKSEAFRLLSMLYNPKLNPGETDLEKRTLQRTVDCVGLFLEAVVETLKDDEMMKTKRVREVLKTTEKVMSFMTDTSSTIPESQHAVLRSIKESLEKLQTDSESKGVASLSEKLSLTITEELKKAPVQEETGPEEDEPRSSKSKQGRKLKVKKKKKKKR